MRVKILDTQDEKTINKELEKIEDEREIVAIIPFGTKTWILSYQRDKQVIEEIKAIRKQIEDFELNN